MSERDILLERLEKKLSQKEKEVEELKRMTDFNDNKVEEIKNELRNELQNDSGNEKIKELEAKVIELNKTVQSLTSDVLYLKEELAKEKPEQESSSERFQRDYSRTQSEDTEDSRSDDQSTESDGIIRADPEVSTAPDANKNDADKEDDSEKQEEESKVDIIVCD